MSERPGLLLLVNDLPSAGRAALDEALAGAFDIHVIDPVPGWPERLEGAATQARAILVKGGIVAVSAQAMARLPRLALICCLGAGFERVDTAAARARGIAVTNGSGANSACVADHAMGLTIALMRRFRAADAAAREGRWQAGFPSTPQVSGKTLGIAGLGRIGFELAERAQAFRMEVLYHNRRPRADLPWEHVPDLRELARRSDVLVSVLPGGDETRHAIDAAVLDALGPRGYLINVGRGSVVNTRDLIDALARGAIAGAGLDVLEDEPAVPRELAQSPDVLLTPHLGGRSPEATAAALQLALRNLLAFARGAPVDNRVA